MKPLVNKKVKMQLVGQDGNAFFILVAFNGAAKKQGWTREEIDTVLTEAKASDYDHLLQVILTHVEDVDEED